MIYFIFSKDHNVFSKDHNFAIQEERTPSVDSSSKTTKSKEEMSTDDTLLLGDQQANMLLSDQQTNMLLGDQQTNMAGFQLNRNLLSNHHLQETVL